MKDLNELKTFIDISLITCGGNPVGIDGTTCLSSVSYNKIYWSRDNNTNEIRICTSNYPSRTVELRV